MGRFILYTLMAFVTAFVGVSWAARGFPTRLSSTPSVGQLTPMLTSQFGDQDAQQQDQQARDTLRTPQGDDDLKLDKVRLDALQAANGYALSPCDQTMKQNLVAALTVYTQMWQRQMDCPRPMNMMMFCGDKKLQEVAAKFSTLLDQRVKEALDKAFEQKGIVKTDFPDEVRFDMLQFTGSNLWFGESAVCLPLMRRANGKR